MGKTSHPLATESFSYSWLIQGTPALFFEESDTNFDFDLSFATSDNCFVADADDIFSDGQLLPVYKKNSSSPVSVSSYSFHPDSSNANRNKPSNKMVHKLLRSLKLLMRCCRKSNRVDDLERKVSEVESMKWVPNCDGLKKKADIYCGLKRFGSRNRASVEQSPCRASHSSSGTENSIDEAILYCKRSIGNPNT